jgi:catechol 2,3-dioxygenase-like lactoylglutathione lyase family enzyme
MSKTYPRAFSHIGITVPDLEKAIDFFTSVMGWYLLMGTEMPHNMCPEQRNVGKR